MVESFEANFSNDAKIINRALMIHTVRERFIAAEMAFHQTPPVRLHSNDTGVPELQLRNWRFQVCLRIAHRTSHRIRDKVRIL